MSPNYTISQQVVLGLLIATLATIGLLSTIKGVNTPRIFSQNPDFFLVNINTATAEELRVIPYISDSIAQEIIRYRQEKGHIKDIDELLNVKGIGPAKLKRMKKYLKGLN